MINSAVNREGVQVDAKDVIIGEEAVDELDYHNVMGTDPSLCRNFIVSINCCVRVCL